MIWLASFPRSGNTFFRNILFEVYGIASSEYHMESDKKVAGNFRDFPVIKTHLLPTQLPSNLQGAKAVYLIRDGRDALVSISHHRKDIVAPGSNYYRNLLEAIIAFNGSFFGGWSGNVQAWTQKAAIVIRYEDLIEDPIGQVERLRSIMDLPPPKREKLPSFQSLKKGKAEYGSGKEKFSSNKEIEKHANKFFRRGISGAYKDEMPKIFQLLFWLKHRKQMKKFYDY